jgi:hypothetical protein
MSNSMPFGHMAPKMAGLAGSAGKMQLDLSKKVAPQMAHMQENQMQQGPSPMPGIRKGK